RFTVDQEYDWGQIDLYAATLSGSSVAGVPTISGLSPSSGAIGAAITVNGSNFGSSQGTTSSIRFDGIPATSSNWTASQITVPVPAGAATGKVYVTVSGVTSVGKAFTLLPTPTISGLSQTVGAEG